MSGAGWFETPASTIVVAGGGALQSSDARVVDASGTPGDVVVAPDVEKVIVQVPVGDFDVLITQPAVTATSRWIAGYTGNDTVSPRATRRVSAGTSPGVVRVDISGGAVADDGPVVVTAEVF